MHPRLCVPFLLLAVAWLWPQAASAQPGKDGGSASANVLYIGQTREIRMSTEQFIKSARSDNPKVATVVLRKDDPRVALVTGLMQGSAKITLTDAKDKTEELTVLVTTAEDELRFQALQRMAEVRRQALEKMIKDTVPTSNVQGLVFGYTVVLKGTIARTEDGQEIMEMARSVYPEFQVPGSQNQPAAPPPTPTGTQPQPQGLGQGPLIINAMRVGGVQQVAIEVTVARVNRSELRNMTFNFLINGNKFFFGSIIKSPQTLAGSISPGIGGSAAALATAGSNLPFGFVTSKNSFEGFLEALRTEGMAKFMGKPSVTTLSGRPAYVMSGGEV